MNSILEDIKYKKKKTLIEGSSALNQIIGSFFFLLKKNIPWIKKKKQAFKVKD